MRSLLSLSLLTLAGLASAQTATMPPETGTFDSDTRGYFFVAPVSFQITGIHVLNEVGNTLQNFQVVRFNNGAPPEYEATTNDFTSLALGFDLDSSTFAPVSVAVNAGDIIGIYGNTVTEVGATYGHNSYHSGTPTTTVFGQEIALQRSGMQSHLGLSTSPNGMQDVFSEPYGTNIGRIEFTYTNAVPEPASMAALGLGGLALLRRRRKNAA